MRLVLVESKFTPDTCDQAKLAVKVWRHKLSRERDDKLLRRAGVSKVWLDIAHEPSRETPMKICVQFEENNALLERLQALTECLFESTKGLKEVAIAVHLSIDRHNDAPPDTFRIYKAGPTP